MRSPLRGAVCALALAAVLTSCSSNEPEPAAAEPTTSATAEPSTDSGTEPASDDGNVETAESKGGSKAKQAKQAAQKARRLTDGSDRTWDFATVQNADAVSGFSPAQIESAVAFVQTLLAEVNLDPALIVKPAAAWSAADFTRVEGLVAAGAMSAFNETRSTLLGPGGWETGSARDQAWNNMRPLVSYGTGIDFFDFSRSGGQLVEPYADEVSVTNRGFIQNLIVDVHGSYSGYFTAETAKANVAAGAPKWVNGATVDFHRVYVLEPDGSTWKVFQWNGDDSKAKAAFID